MSAAIIKLTNCNKETIVDSSIADELKGHRVWMGNQGYAQCTARIGKARCLPLHRRVMKAEPGHVIDHINGDKLDNRRANLRSVTQKKNVWNRHHPPMSASGFYSVYRKRNKWVIAIGKDYRQVSIAGWLSCIVASFFADDVKRTLHGKYATVNYTRVVYTDELRDLLDSTCGTFFRVAFSKRSDGRLRVMHCRTGVKKGTVGGQMSFRPEEKNLYIVYDIDCRSHKAIPLERVLSLRICKENIKVIQRGLSWAS